MKISKHLPLESRKYDNSALQLLVGVSFFLLLPQVNAAEVTKKIIVGAGVEYDSNPALSTTQKEPVWIYSLIPQFVLDVNDEVNRWYLDAAMSVQRNSNEKVLVNREDPKLTVGWDRTYESGMYGIKADYRESSSRVDELRSTGVFSTIDNTEKTKELAAHWQHAINSRWSVLTQAAYHDISYSQVGNLGGYDLGEIGSKLTYANSEKLDTFVQLAYGHFRTDNMFDNTNLVRLVTGANYKLSENFNLAGSIGADNFSGGQSGTDWEAGIKADYVADRMNYVASLNRGLIPSSTGGFQTEDSFKLGWRFDATEHDKFGADYGFYKYRKDTDINLIPLDYQQVGAFYDRTLSSHWHTVVSVTHRDLDSPNSNIRHSNVLGVNLVFDTLNF